MAKTTVKIPKMDAAIICRNEREKRAARIFIDEMHDIVNDALRGESYGLGAIDEVSGCLHWRIKNLDGQASAFFYMDMVSEPITCINIADAVRAMYEEAKAAESSAADADDDADMDAIKADAAWVLGIEEGSAEWYELMDI